MACRVLAACLVVMIGACGGGGGGGGSGDGGGGGGGGGGSGPPIAGDFFPIDAGNVWYYADADGAAETQRVTGTRVVGTRTAVVVTTLDATGATEDLYEKTATGVRPVAPTGASELEVALAQVPLLPLPLVSGTTLTALDQRVSNAGDLDSDGRPDAATLRAQVTVVGFETVTTPAGTFNGAAHVRTVLTQVVTLSSNGRSLSLTSTSDDWYAPDIGLVRNTFTVSDGVGNVTTTQTLRAYRAGALRSESVAPTIATRTPAASSQQQNLALTVVFSEAMDRYPPVSGALVVTGPDGQPVAGAARWVDDRTLAFTPSGTLASGGYTARIAGTVTDLVGNAVAGDLSWTFGIDRQGPVLLSVSPTDGSVDVALQGPLTIVFDEEPDPASVTSASVQLAGPAGTVPLQFSVSGRTVTATPSTALARNTTYGVTVQGVRDRLGNASSASYTASFRTDTGRYAAAQPLPGREALSSPAAGLDVNGDGRNDLVALSGGSNPQGGVIQVYPQNADGTLGTPQPLPVQNSCGAVSFAAGDVDADGRTDLVVAQRCGVEVLRQTADGRMVSAATIAVPGGTLQANVVRTPGGTGIVALPVQTNGPTPVAGPPQVWRRDAATGSYGSALAVTTVLSSINRLMVADINGDGLDDLVLWGQLSNGSGYGLELIVQLNNGIFASAREIPVDSCGGASGVAVGDVNGDRKSDLVIVGNACNGDSVLRVLVQDASGGYGAPTTLPAAGNIGEIAIADIDGDGRQDVVATHGSTGVGVFLQRSDGTLAPEALYDVPASGAGLAIADFNGDGRPDIITSGYLLRQKPSAVGASAVRPIVRPAGLSRWLQGLGAGWSLGVR